MSLIFVLMTDALVPLAVLCVFAWFMSRWTAERLLATDHPIIFTSLIVSPVVAGMGTLIFAAAGNMWASDLAALFDGYGRRPDLYWVPSVVAFEIWLPVVIHAAKQRYLEGKG